MAAGPGDGTVRGRYDLDANPAKRQLRGLRKEAGYTDKAMRVLGDTMDRKVATPAQVARLKAYEKGVADIGDAATRTARQTTASWQWMDRQMERSVYKQRGLLDQLKRKLREVGRERATPTIDLDGVTSAIARIDLLERRLNSLGRVRATPNVGIGGGFRGSVGSAGVSAAARAGGGGGGFYAGTGGFGFFGRRARTAGVLGFAALPAIQALGGAATGLLGTAGGAALGLGAAGIAGAGGLATGFGATAAAAIPLASGLKNAAKAQQQYNQAVAQYGRNSQQAAAAHREYTNALQNAPGGTRSLLRDLKDLRSEWDKASRGAQGNLMGLLANSVATGRSLVPTLGRVSNQTTGALQREGRGFGRYLRSGQSRGFLRTGGGIFDENLGNVRGAGQNVLTTAGNIMVAARPFFREGTSFIEKWTGGWATSTGKIEQTRQKIHGMVEDAKSTWRFFSAGGRLLKDIFAAGSGPGRGLTDSMTAWLDKTDRWIKHNPAQVQKFFRDTIHSTKELAKAGGALVKSLSQMATLLTPILNRFSMLVSGAGSLGLLTPGAGALALGAYRGATGRYSAGGLADKALGFGFGIPAGMVPGGTGAARAGGLGLGSYAAGTYGLARGFGYGRAASAAAGLGGAGMIGLGAAGTAGRAALMGAGKAYLPVGLVMALLQGAGYQGGLGGKAQAALSSFTLGATPMPKTAAQRTDAAGQWLMGNVAAHGLNNQGSRAQLNRLIAARSGLQGSLSGAQSGLIAWLTGKPGEHKVNKGEIKDRIGALDEEIKARRRLIAQIDKENAVRQGRKAGSDLAAGFQNRVNKGMSPERAFAQVQAQARAELRGASPQKQKTLLRSLSGFNADVGKQFPQLKDEATKANRGVERSFKSLGQTVKVVNGRVVADTTKQWSAIRKQLRTQARRGVSEASAAFAQLNNQALSNLTMLGYSRSEALKIIQSTRSSGGGAGVVDKKAQKQGQNFLNSITPPGLRAKGGRLSGGGRGLQDTVRMADGGMGANGEIVLNRHTESRINGMLGAFGTSVGAQVAGEKRKHSDPMMRAKGGRTGGYGNSNIVQLGHRLQRQGYAVSEHPAFGGVHPVHVPGSEHYKNNALDVNADNFPGGEMAAFDKLAPKLRAAGWHVLWRVAGHFDHLHVDGSGKVSGIGGGTGGPAAQKMKALRAPKSKLHGVTGALSQRSGDIYAKGLTKKINAKLARMGGGIGGGGREDVKGGDWNGKVSIFGPPTEPAEQTASGGSSSAPGIALRSSATMGKLFDVNIAGHRGVLRQVDWGPAAWTGRDIDVTGAGARKIGINPSNFPTDAQGSATLKRTKGGRMAAKWGGWFGRGGSFMANSPTMIGVGDKKEHVQITPHRPKTRPASVRLGVGNGVNVNITIQNVDMRGGNTEDLKNKLEEAAALAARRIRAEIEDHDGETARL